MRTLWGNRRGFSGVEMMIVVVVIGIIGGAVAGTQVHMKRRATERVVAGDLDAYAQAQMSVRHEQGRFASHADLLVSGFQWSDDVELSEVRTADDRFFVRVRHTPTGYSCALDLSPVTGRARNRKVCRGSASDPDLAVPPGIIVTPPAGDTATVARPPTVPEIPDGYLLPPDVGDVAEVVLAPGTSRVVLFPVTNRSGEARVFTFGASSANRAVVPAPDRPADARLEADERATVPVAVSVAPGSLADQGGDVELRASDAGDRGYAASGGVRVRAALVLARPAVAAPAPEVRDPGEMFTVQYRVRNASNAARVFRLGAAIPAGSALSLAGALSDQPLDALEERVVPVTYRLDGGAEGGTQWTARLVVTDRDAAGYAETSTPFQVTARLALEAPAVTAPAERTEEPGAEFTLLWQVTNRSNAPRDFRLTPGSSSPELSPVSPGAAFSRRIGRGQTAGVAVTYRLAVGATCTSVHAATLGVSDAAAPALAASASGTLRTATVLAAPAVAAPPARSDLPGASFGATWQVTNRTNCERTVRVEVLADGDVEVTGATGAGVVRLQPFEQRAVEGRYRLRDNSVHQAESRPLLRATDEAAAAYTAGGAFAETTALRLCAPTLVGPVGVPAQPQQPGTGATVTHRVTNCSNAARTFSFVAASSTPGAVPDPADPTALAIPAFGTADVEFGYALPAQAAGGAFSDVTLTAADAGDGSLADARSFRVTAAVILNAPALSAFAAQALLPGEAGSSAAVLTSRSNVPVDFCFASSVAPGDAPAGEVVAPVPPAPPCLRVGAYQAATVAQALAVAATAEHPRTNVVMVRAYDSARPALAAEQGFPVTAGLLLAHPTLEVPATPPPLAWMVGQERSIAYPVVNRSNAARELCLSVVPGGAELLAQGAAPCTRVPARQGHTFQHVLRGASEGEPMVAVKVHDRLVPEYQDTGTFSTRVIDAKPVALWTPPSPVYVRKWAEFDAHDSFSPVGARIVKYVWSWGLFNQRWTGSRFEPGGSGVATDELTSSTARRAWDLRGTFQVCLAVEDDAGRRSPPNCREITTLAETRARLAFRYRGWWYDPSDFCVDVPWDNQCPKEHGNARWEILLNQSQGDVPIKRAWASVRVDYWQTDDRFEQTYSYTGNVETLPYSFPSGGQTIRYDFMSNRHKANGSVETGRWRILDTDGTAALGWPQSPNLGLHPLVLNANLGSATGAFDGGPHWVPDEVWITLFVEDAFGNVTQQARFLDHERSAWRGGECINGTSGWGCVRGYERLVPAQEAPVVSLRREDLGNDTYRFTGAGSSSDGRVVDSWWEITTSWFDPSQGRSETSVYRGDAYEVRADLCEIVDVALVYVDDRGQRGQAWERVSRADDRRCIEIGTPY
jgi:type II secretory pathway pseudopilin PulG